MLLLEVVAEQSLGVFQVAALLSQLARDGASSSCEFGSCASHIAFEAYPMAQFEPGMNLR
ncbi:MAG: hypothetical protein EZS28_018565, partial [Streblomastix strix]